jgi:YihY family inner membrane protein
MADGEAPPASWTDHHRLMPWRRRSALIDVLARTVDGFRRHRTGRNSAVVAHYGFLSVFPLVVVLTTILGFVLQDRPDLQRRIVDSALNQIPIVGQQIGSDPSKLRGSVVILVVGLLAALWAGMKAFVALQGAFDDVVEVPLHRRSNLAVVRLHALIGIGIVGVAQVGAAILTSFVGALSLPGVSKVLLVLAAAVINTGVLALCYRWLCSAKQPWPMVVPGAVVGGVVFAGLQLLGTAIVGRSIANASAVYGTFASVIGLISWLSLHSMVSLLGAEMNVALRQREQSATPER